MIETKSYNKYPDRNLTNRDKIMFNIPCIVSDDEIELYFKTISYNVREIRKTKGLSQLEVALSIGQKSSGFYANAENYSHDKHFNLLHLCKLSKLFDVPTSVFFEPIPINDIN